MKTCEECDGPCPAEYDRCGDCSERMADVALSRIEPPEGGWPRGSDMDRI